jgi:hypothetical protein
MPSRNEWPASCGVCGSSIRRGEGVVDTSAAARGYQILCPEHAPEERVRPPGPPEASSLPSIHKEDEHFER